MVLQLGVKRGDVILTVKTYNSRKHFTMPRTWTDVSARDRNKWQGLVNVVVNLRVPQGDRNFLTS